MKRPAILAALVAAIVLLLWAMTPASIEYRPGVPALPDSLDEWLASSEAAAPYPLVPGTEKRVRWIEPGVKTDFAIVYLHGFSATRQETAPMLQMVADALGANLYETRLAGHGRSERALEETVAEDWLDDAAEALAIGSRIGDRIIIVGVSTGATLTAAIADHPLMSSVSDVVMLSPNFALADDRAELLTKPAGPQLADLLLGETRSFEIQNEQHGLYWSSTYKTRAVVEMMRLVDFARQQLPLELNSRLLVVYSPDDSVISPQAVRDTFAAASAADKTLVAFTDSDDPQQHMLAGDILSPSSTRAVADLLIQFLSSREAT